MPETPDVDVNAIINLLPTKWQKALPNILQVLGLGVGILGYGYQKMVSIYPDMSQLDGAPGWLALSGAAIVVSGGFMHSLNAKSLTTATKAALFSPPLTSEGTECPKLTLSIGVQQLLNTGKPEHVDLAAKIVEALKGGA